MNNIRSNKVDGAGLIRTKDKEWLLKEYEYKVRGIELIKRVNELHMVSIRVLDEVNKFHRKITDEAYELLEWDEKERVLSSSDELDNKLRDEVNKLRELEGEYDIFREEVNKFYNKEVMPPHVPLDDLLLEADKEDSGDWWKRCE